MRLIKMLGLTVTAVAALMAFMGVSTASATLNPLDAVVLCKTQTVGALCAAEDHFGSGTELHAELVAGTHATLAVGGIGNVLCEESAALGKTTSLLAHGSLETVTFEACTVNGVECEIEVVEISEKTPYLVKGQLTSNHLGYETIITGGGEKGPRARTNCGTVINCTYGSKTGILMTAEENANDTVLKVEQALQGEGVLCGLPNPVWKAQYLTRCLSPPNTYTPCYLRMHNA